jgi:hypothetical protein
MMPLQFFHRTDDANAILSSGFKDGTGNYLTTNEYSGVWLSNIPLDANEGAFGGTLLLVELDLAEADLAQFEWIEEGKGFREWLIPAALVNSKGKVQIVEEPD